MSGRPHPGKDRNGCGPVRLGVRRRYRYTAVLLLAGGEPGTGGFDKFSVAIIEPRRGKRKDCPRGSVGSVLSSGEHRKTTAIKRTASDHLEDFPGYRIAHSHRPFSVPPARDAFRIVSITREPLSTSPFPPESCFLGYSPPPRGK